jgi:endoglucanase
LKIPSDKIANGLFVEVHFYGPWDFAGDSVSDVYLWGKQYARSSHVSSWGQED